eukprot:1665762-Heterocapsa_arctica.AAC.1
MMTSTRPWGARLEPHPASGEQSTRGSLERRAESSSNQPKEAARSAAAAVGRGGAAIARPPSQ